MTAPDIIRGRRVRRVEIEVAPGVRLALLEAADVEAVLEEAVADGTDAYAGVLWPSAVAAAGRLAGLVRAGQTVLDIGAGTGLAALTAARLGARAIALDHDAFARDIAAHAAALQQLAVEVRAFDVRSDTPLPEADIVVIADLLYEPELARAAAQRTLEARAGGAVVIVGDPARYGRADFTRMLHAAGVTFEFDEVLIPMSGDAAPSRVGVAVIEPPTRAEA